MKIEILGDGCVKCRTLEKHVKTALAQSGIEAECLTVNDPERLAHYNILTLPGLAVDGELKSKGEMLSVQQVKALLG